MIPGLFVAEHEFDVPLDHVPQVVATGDKD